MAGTEFTVSGVVILVTMTTYDNRLASRFALRFFRSQNNEIFPPRKTLYPSTFVTGEGRQVTSFPENMAVNYTNDAMHFMLISRPIGREFSLTNTFVDIEVVGEDCYRRSRMVKEVGRTGFIDDGQ